MLAATGISRLWSDCRASLVATVGAGHRCGDRQNNNRPFDRIAPPSRRWGVLPSALGRVRLSWRLFATGIPAGFAVRRKARLSQRCASSRSRRSPEVSLSALYARLTVPAAHSAAQPTAHVLGALAHCDACHPLRTVSLRVQSRRASSSSARCRGTRVKARFRLLPSLMLSCHRRVARPGRALGTGDELLFRRPKPPSWYSIGALTLRRTETVVCEYPRVPKTVGTAHLRRARQKQWCVSTRESVCKSLEAEENL
jgi:hypothetical protein